MTTRVVAERPKAAISVLDTGVAHFAPALQLLSVVIFFSTDPRRWAPLNTALHRTIYDPAGVSAESVLREALDLLR